MRRFADILRAAVADRRFAALNTIGLALGVAVFLLLALYVRHERGINAFPSADRLWVVQERHLGPGRSGARSARTTGQELDLLRADNPGLVGARYSGVGGSVRVAGQLRYDNIVLVEPGFFQLFDWPSVAGDPVRALASPDAVVLTRSAARTYSGGAEPIGRTLPITVAGVERPYRIARSSPTPGHS